MSDPALDLVFNAISEAHDNGVHLRASSTALARLAATAGSKPKNAPLAARPEAPASSKIAAFPTPLPSTPSGISISKSPTPGQPVTAEIPNAGGSKAERIAELRGPVLACTKCEHLVKSRTQVVFGVGNPEAELMFVGEAPGADEDIVGEPFVGRAGQLLTKIIEAMSFKRPDVYIANVLKCRPDIPPGTPGNRKPTHAEMNVCKPYLLQQIEIIQPKVLVALGATAVEGLLGIEKAGITRMRGNWREFQGIPVMPTFHPSFLLRPSSEQLANKRLVWEDMMQVLERLGRPITEKQRGYFLQKS